MMQQPIEQGGDRGGVAKQLAPVFDGTVRGDQRRGTLVAAHDDLQQILGGGRGQLAHAEVVEDEQRDGREVGERGPASAGELRLGEARR